MKTFQSHSPARSGWKRCFGGAQLALCALSVLLLGGVASAQTPTPTPSAVVQTPPAGITPIPYTDTTGTYSQDFDGPNTTSASATPLPNTNQNDPALASTGTSSARPRGFGFVETSPTPTAAPTLGPNNTYGVDTGAASSGNTYSFGTAAAPTDRALGTLLTNAFKPYFGVIFQNNTSGVLNTVVVTYNGEQYRDGGSTATTFSPPDRLDFQYQVGATDLVNGTFTDFDAGDFTSPISPATAGVTTAATVVDGNAAGRVPITATITGLNVPIGGTIAIRFFDFNQAGSDDSLAVDDLTFSGATLTAVNLVGFKAQAVSGGTWLWWKTGYEVNNLGFNVYRQVRDAKTGKWGALVKVNPRLIAGSQIQGNANKGKGGGFVYAYGDTLPSPTYRNLRYWLEDVDANGTLTKHGPAAVVQGQGSLGDATHPNSPFAAQ